MRGFHIDRNQHRLKPFAEPKAALARGDVFACAGPPGTDVVGDAGVVTGTGRVEPGDVRHLDGVEKSSEPRTPTFNGHFGAGRSPVGMPATSLEADDQGRSTTRGCW